MGTPTYSKTEETRSIFDKFVTWLNAIDFNDDEEMFNTLKEIRSECTVRIDAIEEEDINRAEAEGSAP